MLSFKAVSRVYHFLLSAFFLISIAEFNQLFGIMYSAIGLVVAYKGYLMYKNLQPSRDKAALTREDIKLCRRYMIVQFLLAVVSFLFVFIPYSGITYVIAMTILLVLEIYISAPLKKVFEEIF